MVNAVVAILARAATTMMTGTAVGVHTDTTSYTLSQVKFQRVISGLGSVDEQDASDSSALRAALYTPLGEPVRMGDRITIAGEDGDWFVLDEDHGGTDRAVLKIAMMRQDSGTYPRNVTIYRMARDGSQTVLGPFKVNVNYDNRVAKEVATQGSQARRVDGTMSSNEEFPVHAGDLFTIDAGDGKSLSGVVVDVNRSVEGRVEARISVTRGVARTPPRFG